MTTLDEVLDMICEDEYIKISYIEEYPKIGEVTVCIYDADEKYNFDDQVYYEYLNYIVERIEVGSYYNCTYYLSIYIKENE